MNIQPCDSTPLVEDPIYRCWIAAGMGGVYAPGRTPVEALDNARQHARRDRIRVKEWKSVWIECIGTGEVVAEANPPTRSALARMVNKAKP